MFSNVITRMLQASQAQDAELRGTLFWGQIAQLAALRWWRREAEWLHRQMVAFDVCEWQWQVRAFIDWRTIAGSLHLARRSNGRSVRWSKQHQLHRAMLRWRTEASTADGEPIANAIVRFVEFQLSCTITHWLRVTRDRARETFTVNCVAL